MWSPIEKKPLNHFLPGTPILSFGTAGCNLACKFCQNWDISKSRETDTLADQAAPDRIARAAKALGCASVAYTYNDPVIFMEYAIDVAQACQEYGIKSVAVTAGYICPEPRAELYRYMDAANVDLKGFSERFYWKICGGHLQPVLDTLTYLKRETRVWFEITTLLISGENDSEQEIDAMTGWVVENLGPEVPMHFTAFHPDWKMMDKTHTPPATLTRRATSRYATASAMLIPATCMIRPAAAPTATGAGRRSSGATGTRSAIGILAPAGAVSRAARRARVSSSHGRAAGARGACPCASGTSRLDAQPKPVCAAERVARKPFAIPYPR